MGSRARASFKSQHVARGRAEAALVGLSGDCGHFISGHLWNGSQPARREKVSDSRTFQGCLNFFPCVKEEIILEYSQRVT